MRQYNLLDPKIVAFFLATKLGSIKQAAKMLGLTTVAFYQRIHSIEKKTGQELMIKSMSGIFLTDTGKALVESLSKIVLIAENTVENLLKPTNINLNVLLTPFMTTLFIVPHVHEFYRRCPNVRLNLHSSFHKVDLMSKFDVSILPEKDAIGNDYTSHFLHKTRISLFASKDYINKHGKVREISDLDDHKLIASYHGQPMSVLPAIDWHITIGRPLDDPRPSSIICNSGKNRIHSALSGMGIASFVGDSIHRFAPGHVDDILPDVEGGYMISYIYYKTNASNIEAINSFIEFLHDIFAQKIAPAGSSGIFFTKS